MEFIQTEKQKEKRILKSEDILRALWNQKNNIHITGVPEGKEEETGRKII